MINLFFFPFFYPKIFRKSEGGGSDHLKYFATFYEVQLSVLRWGAASQAIKPANIYIIASDLHHW